MALKNINELLSRYQKEKNSIERRLEDFSKMKNASDENIYAELAFCMLTPQSKAKSCWAAIEELNSRNLLFSDDINAIANVLKSKVRFHNNKAGYIVKNKNLFLNNGKLDIKNTVFSFDNTKELRLWLVKNVKGYGWKEAAHFLRNIGLGKDLAILDRHILRNMERYGIIDEMPKSLTTKKYLEIENQMRKFCDDYKIPMTHIDLLFWSMGTGEIFK